MSGGLSLLVFMVVRVASLPTDLLYPRQESLPHTAFSILLPVSLDLVNTNSVEPVLDNQEVDLDRVEQLLLRLQRSLTRGLMTPSAASSNDLMQPLMYTTARGRIPTSSMPAISRRASAPVLLDEDEIEEDGGVDVAGPNPVAINQSEASNPDNNVVDANLEDNGGGQLLSRRKRNRRCLHNCIKKKVLHPHQCHMLC